MKRTMIEIKQRLNNYALFERIREEIKNNWASHLVSGIIPIIIGVLLSCLILTSVVISGHKYKTEKIFQNKPLTNEQLISKKINIGESGGYQSLSFNLISDKEIENISIKYESSFDGKTWLHPIDSNIIINNKKIHTSKPYIKTLSVTGSPYIRFKIGLRRQLDPNESVKLDLTIFKHM